MGNNNFQLLPGQRYALSRLKAFASDSSARVFILKGYAGTGKTTLVGELLNMLDKMECYLSLVASTGRAAKILCNVTDRITCTVHSLIYKYLDFNQELEEIIEETKKTGKDQSNDLFLVFGASRVDMRGKDPHLPRFYIIDEASMVSDQAQKKITQAVFGTGRLLLDLLNYDPEGKFVFVGDACQLPPVNQPNSPALTVAYFKEKFHIAAEEVELTEIVRQAKGNDIALAAQKMRHLYFNPQPWKWAKFPMRGYKNIHLVSSQTELLRLYIEDVREKGYNTSTLIGATNRQCNNLTQIIRPALGIQQLTLTNSDLLLVTQNNLVSGLMNGDLVKVVEVADYVTCRAGLTFVKVSVKELFTQKEYSQLLIADVIYTNQTNLTQYQQKALYIDFAIRMGKMGIKQHTHEFDQAMRTDEYLNALRCVFGYVLTCHKSQGGEWDNVYLDIPRNLPLNFRKPYVYQWVYTAMTRAKKELYVTEDFFII